MRQDARHQLEDLLDREISAAHSLAGILAEERNALTGASPDAVHETASDKVRMLGEIESLESQRRALWDASGVVAAAPGDNLMQRWHSLMKVVAGCRTANEVNGHIINIRQNQIRQLFDIVRGGAPVTYGPQGKTFARTLRALARA